MSNFIKHKLTHWSQLAKYREELGEEKYTLFINRVYTLLDKMERGSSYCVTERVRPASRDLFIKCACQFMIDSALIKDERNYYTHSFYFTEDYKEIQRL